MHLHVVVRTADLQTAAVHREASAGGGAAFSGDQRASSGQFTGLFQVSQSGMFITVYDVGSQVTDLSSPGQFR